MKNPCEECIIKVNCTEVCNDKINYGILIKQALDTHRKERDRNQYYWDTYHRYLDLWVAHKGDQSKIGFRRVTNTNL